MNSLEIFVDADDCLALINSISTEKVLLIVSDELGEPVVSRVRDLQQVMRIYVLCQTEEQAENWSTDVAKIPEIYTDIDRIIEQIRADVLDEEKRTLSISLISPRTNPKEEPAFLTQQLVKEILLDSDEMNEARQDLIDFVRKEYQGNDEQLRAIDAFEQDYQRDNPLQFYQPQSFLFKVIERKSVVEVLERGCLDVEQSLSHSRGRHSLQTSFLHSTFASADRRLGPVLADQDSLSLSVLHRRGARSLEEARRWFESVVLRAFLRGDRRSARRFAR